MTVSFDSFPSDIRIPFVGVEFSATRASQGPVLQQYVALAIGQILAAGSASADELHKVTRIEDVIALAGRGSMLHRQLVGWFENNTQTEMWIAALDDDGAATDHAHTIVVSGTATEDGTAVLYLGGERVTVGVDIGDDNDAVAAAINTALGLELDLPHTYAVVTDTVTGTARNAGAAWGGDYDVRDSYADGEGLPDGITIAYAETVAGATNPTLTTLIAAMGDTWFNILMHPYTDATSLTAIENELERRFGPTVSVDGASFAGASGTQSTLTTLGETRNSKSSSIWAQPGINPLMPSLRFSAAVAGAVAKAGQADPARPFQTLVLNGILPPIQDDLFTNEERGIGSGLLYSGIATTKVVAGGKVAIERGITTYQTNEASAPDTAYLDINTLLTLMYLRFSFRVRIQTKYPRHKLADTGTRFGDGQLVMTPLIGKGEAVAWFEEMETLGLVEGRAQFKADLVVERNGSDVNRLDWLLSPDLMNQLIVSATKMAFLL